MPHLAEGNKYWWLSLSTYFFSSINHPILMREKGAWNEGGRLQREQRDSRDPAGVQRRGGLASPAESVHP